MPNDAKACKHHKYNMVGASKLKSSEAIYTIAIQSKPQKAKNTKNSPKACQNNAKTCMDYSQGKLA